MEQNDAEGFVSGFESNWAKQRNGRVLRLASGVQVDDKSDYRKLEMKV